MVNSKLFKKFKNTSSKLCPKIITSRYSIGYILLETRNISLWPIFELFTTTMGRKIKIWRHIKKDLLKSRILPAYHISGLFDVL